MTNLEGRVLLRRQALTPPAGVRGDLAVLSGLAARLGHPHGFPDDPREVFEELRRASAGGPADYGGITYERIAAEKGIFWPCPSTDHPGTPRPFLNRFATPDGRARFIPVEHRPAVEDIDEDYPYYLTTGRLLAHYQSGAQTRRIDPLMRVAPEAQVELHPDLARRLGVRPGERLRVISRRGAAEGVVTVNATMRPDTVFMPFHFADGSRANLVTSDALDPISRMPEFKVCAVRLETVA